MHLTPANVSEVTQLEQVIGELQPSRVFADTGYASKANRAILQSKGIKHGLCYKTAGVHTLSRWQRRFNSLVCKPRWRVKQVFGTTKRRFQFTCTRYMSLPKVEYEALFKLIAYSALKAIRRCSFSFPEQRLASKPQISLKFTQIERISGKPKGRAYPFGSLMGLERV